MTLQEAIQARHSVRQYIDKPLQDDVVTTLKTKIDEVNAKSGLHVQLVLLAQTLGLNTCWVGVSYCRQSAEILL